MIPSLPNPYCKMKPAVKTVIKAKPYATLAKQSEAMGKVFQYDPVVPPKGGPKKEFSREVDKLVPIAHTSTLNLFKAAKSARKGDM